MTTVDNDLRAELVCSTERAGRRSRNSRNAPRSTYLAVQNFVESRYNYSLATNSIATQS